MEASLKDFKRDVSTLLIGVDSLFGGDIQHPSGRNHFIADTWYSGEELPEIYSDEFAAYLRQAGGVGPKDAEGAREFVRRHNLYELPSNIKRQIPRSKQFGHDRIDYFLNLVSALGIILHTAVQIAEGHELLPFEIRYRAATAGREPVLLDAERERESLRAALASMRYAPAGNMSLRDAYLTWRRDQGDITPENVGAKAAEIIGRLRDLTRERVLPHLSSVRLEGPYANLPDVPFDGHRFETVSGVHFTGSSAYRGGEKNGRPALEGLFEYNTDHPISEPELWHLCAHEVIPGHWFNSAVADLLWRSGKLGFEAPMQTMCTPVAVFQEGWAESALYLLFGSHQGITDYLGSGMGVVLAAADLQNVGKHNASVLRQREGWSDASLRRYLAEELALPDHYIEKLAGAWATHPIVGPMYGPAYYHGKQVVRNAIDTHGSAAVASVGLQQFDVLDISTFERYFDGSTVIFGSSGA